MADYIDVDGWAWFDRHNRQDKFDNYTAMEFASMLVRARAELTNLRAALSRAEEEKLSWDRSCCRREREACYEAAKKQEEHGWGRKGYHPVADSIRGRGEWIKFLDDEARKARGADIAGEVTETKNDVR